MNYRFVGVGAICALLSVAIGAFGAHMLKSHLTAEMQAIYETGVQYHMVHSLGLIIIGVLAALMPASKHLVRAGWAMLIGIILFSGSLYALSVTGIKPLGAITPLGGVAFLYGWLSVALAAFQHKKS
ncbi:DUF423 domain-containing protein [Paenibacillus doosanensis]|uniref:DUF423 domain-containing protein n=1 Tax=Paenibacillus konkukensis TaxID=2020716 RepID=A0ABY4RPI0_9BACL|nr:MULTISPECIES: DUF423 domain-containing protein [Paenibacillus]MCS7462363.1 DUF423 domain-containing protein [Paenibacillus doosanensis]UQZ83257.1 hypothetical protein SK3146_02418 [Paenibacillus konkukensis]